MPISATTKTKARVIPKVPSLAPAAKAVARAKDGARHRLDSRDVRPGCIAWMPFASVIKVTHRDHHKGASDGVEVVYDASLNKYMAGDTERPGRRAWNHPCVIVRREKNDVWILGMTTYKGRTLEEKLAKYPPETRRKIASGVVPIFPALMHPLRKEGDKRYEALRSPADGLGKMKDVGGYVKLSTVYKMDWRDLQTFNGSKRCLDEESTARLVGLVGSVCGLGWAKGGVKEKALQNAEKEIGKEAIKEKAVKKPRRREVKKEVKKPVRPRQMKGKQGDKMDMSTFKAQWTKSLERKLNRVAERVWKELEADRAAK